MDSKVKEKLELELKDEIRCRELIKKFNKSLYLWFIYGTDGNATLEEVFNSCVEIILHGLKNESEKLQITENVNALNYDSSPTTSNESTNANNKNGNSDINLNQLYKIVDDFEWVRNAVRRNSPDTLPGIFVTEGKVMSSPEGSHVAQWLKQNLNEHNLCPFLQYLINDKELLEEHYNEKALLRQEKYVSIIVIGLTAFETQQFGLLCQINTALNDNIRNTYRWERCISQPNINLAHNTKSSHSTDSQKTGLFSKAISKAKSLPELKNKILNLQDFSSCVCLKRPKCKSISKIKHRTRPQNIPQKIQQSANGDIKPSCSHVVTSYSSSFLYDYDDDQPTTSHASSNRSKSPLSNYTLNSNKSATSSLMSTSMSSFNSNNTTKCIQLINTDDIKIWTDHSWELKQKSKQQTLQQPTASCTIPTSSSATPKPCKSLSPLNSFFSSLFSTPPSYTSWFIDHDTQTEHNATETAIESIIPDNNNFQNCHSVSSIQPQSSSVSLGSTVFDKFLPIDGKKVRTRKSQNLFDDVNTTLDCSGTNILVSSGTYSTESPELTLSPGPMSGATKNSQSLTRFLQMSHLSRNITDLEKENAHFRISEAIISAIEHIKWNKLETHKSCLEVTPLATDCLAATVPSQSPAVHTKCSVVIAEEHIPYAELEEVSYDLLSAEVVGLSLISKFDEKQLPKVSELKWLVSDDDTPQKLLPMPDLTSSANPDEHVIRSATRGTRYWAPPRQQIIFTDHPPPNRKELLKKQNYRCAGCGMLVSPQYMQSFRYCTYLGKYNCTGCHRNQISATPAKILQAWDFKCYPVSVFAYRLLEQMYAYPLFYVPDLNPALYIRCKSLLTARNKRLKLKYVKDFIRMCRFALREHSYFESVPDYITADIDNWSMSDFIDARAKCLHRSIDELIIKCENHIFNCVLCTARGFICEYCRVDVIIYPWGSRVERCDRCGTCFHRSCWKSMSEKCCRCQRFDKRQDEINDVI